MAITKNWVNPYYQSASKTQGPGSVDRVDPGPDPWWITWCQEADKYESDVAYVAFTRLVAPFCMITTALSLLQAGSPQVAFICEAWHIPLDSHQFPH